ncbi:hypothetical protein DH2020_021080 [Rehmannia glutinosa]|uniref:Uncharacterized protein n=1 Tax=Rehmannia glutinosa TaxID=99300 RepID=A0ABR0WAT9_REHGL
MQGLKKLNLLQFIFLLNTFECISQKTPLSYCICGGIQIKPPFFNQNPSNSSLLSHMILCKSDNLYFRTTIGLFQISSIDYENKLLTISHNYCSPTSSFISPHHLSAGFSPLSSPNSLILMNCSNRSSKMSIFPCNNTRLSGCASESAKGLSSCSVIDDVTKLEKGFHPKEMNCSHYIRVYRSSTENYESGTRINFDIPDHVPNFCNECEKRDGNCGAGLRCVCHPKKCKDKVISVGAVLKPWGNIFFYLVLFILMMGLFQ